MAIELGFFQWFYSEEKKKRGEKKASAVPPC